MDPKYYKKGDPVYESSKSVFNGWVKKDPRRIYQPKTNQEIVWIIQFAQSQNLTISIKNGGHSAYGQSISRDGIMIDMSCFKNIEVSKNKEFVTVGGGVLSGELDLVLSKWNVAIPLGDCPGVGVSGLALGGGNGFLSRKYGLTCDWIESVELITANEGIIHVSEKNEPELFKALKGAGQNNFGVVASITFRLIDLPKQVTVFNYCWPLEKTIQAIEQVEILLAEHPKSLALYIRVNREFENKPGIRVYGIYPDAVGEVERIKAALDGIGATFYADIINMSYYKAQQINASSITPDISFHWENAILVNRITPALSSQIIDWFLKCPTAMGRINIDPLGGEIAAYSNSMSAFQHRNGSHVLSVIGVWSGKMDNDPIRLWTSSCFKDLVQEINLTSYQNYAGYNYSPERYFSNNTEKLIDLKRKWDPETIFEGLLTSKKII